MARGGGRSSGRGSHGGGRSGPKPTTRVTRRCTKTTVPENEDSHHSEAETNSHPTDDRVFFEPTVREAIADEV